MTRVPLLMVVPPAYVLEPKSVSVPAAFLMREPAPLITPVKEPAPTVRAVGPARMIDPVDAPLSARAARVWLALVKVMMPLAVRVALEESAPATLRNAPVETETLVLERTPVEEMVTVPAAMVVLPVKVLTLD